MTSVNAHPGMTYDQCQLRKRDLRIGWTLMWIAIPILPTPFFFIAIALMAIACGHGIGVASWPGFGRAGFKLMFWAIMGPLTPVILFVVAGMIVGALR